MAPSLTLVQATCLARDNKLKEATNLLNTFADSHPSSALEMKLAAVHLLLTDVNIKNLIFNLILVFYILFYCLILLQIEYFSL